MNERFMKPKTFIYYIVGRYMAEKNEGKGEALVREYMEKFGTGVEKRYIEEYIKRAKITYEVYNGVSRTNYHIDRYGNISDKVLAYIKDNASAFKKPTGKINISALTQDLNNKGMRLMNGKPFYFKRVKSVIEKIEKEF